MPLIFSYGTLQEDKVQLSTFGRLVQGQRDELLGFEQSWVRIEDPHVVETGGKTHHANITFNGRDDSRVGGTVFEITDAELAAADQYEQLAASAGSYYACFETGLYVDAALRPSCEFRAWSCSSPTPGSLGRDLRRTSYARRI
jgi:hypothetical protein